MLRGRRLLCDSFPSLLLLSSSCRFVIFPYRQLVDILLLSQHIHRSAEIVQPRSSWKHTLSVIFTSRPIQQHTCLSHKRHTHTMATTSRSGGALARACQQQSRILSTSRLSSRTRLSYPVLAASDASSTTAMGMRAASNMATFKIPKVLNEPNVRHSPTRIEFVNDDKKAQY